MLSGPSFIPNQMTKAVILCHGYGSNGADLASLSPYLAGELANTGFFCPNAPTPMMFNGYEWFSLSDYSGSFEMVDNTYLDTLVGRCQKSSDMLTDYMNHIKITHQLTDKDIVLGGFSQGGLIALYTALTGECDVVGVIGCSAVPLVFDKALTPAEVKRKLPVLLTHGAQDDVVPAMGANISVNELKKVGISAEVKIFDGLMHGIDGACLAEIKRFIGTIFDKN